MFYKIRDFIRKHFIGYRPSDMFCLKEKDNKIDHLSYEETSLWVDDEDGKKPVETIVAFDNKELVNKINEIIDYINKEG